MAKVDHVIANLAKIGASMPTRVGNALRAEGEIELTEMKRQTPVWNPARRVPRGHAPGQLRSSGRLEGPFVDGRDIWVRFVFGGGAIDYAFYVHEDEDAFHATGNAGFVAKPLRASAPYMPARVAERMHLTGAVGGDSHFVSDEE